MVAGQKDRAKAASPIPRDKNPEYNKVFLLILSSRLTDQLPCKNKKKEITNTNKALR